MRSHVNLLGILHVAWGAMALLLGAAALLLAGGAAAIARSTAGDALAAGFTTVVFVVCAVALAAGGWANLWAGRALRQHHAPGRLALLALAVLNLFILPFGTALAVYTLWVLLHNETRELFEPALQA
ncbi:MAG TPA: hypothetical protein VFX12_07690 [Vicinamibacterales bacterium]|nr:hypothetical protein [Vicinamibacterales bacterium]